MKFYKFSLAIIWFIISFILLVLPGNDFPKTQMIDGFDKVVHFGIFSLISYLFCQPFKRMKLDESVKKNWFLRIAILALVYGIVMEYVQKYFVLNRSFDVGDILFDGLGSLAGYVWSLKFFIKKEISL